MVREIGSEFHRAASDQGRGMIFPRPGSLVFSGRTAIEAVLQKIPNAHTALLPSYCCDSMIVPFRASGIEVKFYNVGWDHGLKIAVEDTADILLWCNYFGFRNEMPSFDGVIIEDITHSFLSDSPAHPQSDFLIASLRKWEPVNCGGYCSVEAGGTAPPREFAELKTEAMKLKADYLEKPDEEKKAKYLQMFRNSNHWLAENYSGLLIDSCSRGYIESVDTEKQRRIRRENAKALYDGLRGKVQFMFPIEDMDCPLFVPVLLPDRDVVRKKLIENEIYCPVHWPKPDGGESNLYEMELSLICDQRYGAEDMERIVSALCQAVSCR